MALSDEKILLAQQKEAVHVLNSKGLIAYEQHLQTIDILEFLNEEEKEYFKDLSYPDEDDGEDVDCDSLEEDGVDRVDGRSLCLPESNKYETRMKFTPGILDEILKMIRNCSHSIKIAVFMFTYDYIFKEVCYKKKSNPQISVVILVDKTKFNEFLKMAQNVIKKCFENKKIGIKVLSIARNGKPPGKAHEKFMIVDESHALTGSYNFTWTSEYVNYEQVVISNDKTAIVTPLLNQFERISQNIQYQIL